MVASKLATLKHGEAGNGRKVEVSNDTSTLSDAAKQLSVGRATVARAKQVQEHGSETVKQAQRAIKAVEAKQQDAMRQKIASQPKTRDEAKTSQKTVRAIGEGEKPVQKIEPVKDNTKLTDHKAAKLFNTNRTYVNQATKHFTSKTNA